MADLSVIFWNVWSDNQMDEMRLAQLCERLGQLVDEHDPDVFGLNEVVLDERSGRSRVLEYLQSRGYHTHFAPHGPDREHMVVGSALVSRTPAASVTQPVWGPDLTAAVRGFRGHDVRAIDGIIPVGREGVRVVVNYWAHLVPYNWLNHRAHVRAFRQYLAQVSPMRTIIGGDFNEPKYMPAIRKLGLEYNRATGSWRSPTWRWQGQRRRLLQASYDNVLWSRRDDLALRQFSILPMDPSDHAPLLGRFWVGE